MGHHLKPVNQKHRINLAITQRHTCWLDHLKTRQHLTLSKLCVIVHSSYSSHSSYPSTCKSTKRKWIVTRPPPSGPHLDSGSVGPSTPFSWSHPATASPWRLLSWNCNKSESLKSYLLFNNSSKLTRAALQGLQSTGWPASRQRTAHTCESPNTWREGRSRSRTSIRTKRRTRNRHLS